MAKPLTDAAVRKQLDTVKTKLTDGKSKGKQRLDLLRRQAELGDQRDAAEQKARRSNG